MATQRSAIIQLEICTGSLSDCLIAEKSGADRVELNSALSLGGLTPTAGTVISVLQCVSVPVIAMARPRESGFCYSDTEFQSLLADIKWLIDQGVAGVAFGVLDQHGHIDVPRCQQVMDLIGDQQSVFHRAFDLVPPTMHVRELDRLIELGVDRVMTSGGQHTAWEGRREIAALQKQAARKIEILAAGSIRPDHVADLIGETGITQVHAGLGRSLKDSSYSGGGSIHFSSTPPADPAQFRQSCQTTIEQMVLALQKSAATDK